MPRATSGRARRAPVTLEQAPDGSVAVEETTPPPVTPAPAPRYAPLMYEVGALVGGVLVAWELYETVARRLTHSRR